MKGRGDAVCGSFFPPCASVDCPAWSLVLAAPEAAFAPLWSLLVLEALLLLWSLLDGVDAAPAAPAAAPLDCSLVLDELLDPTGCE